MKMRMIVKVRKRRVGAGQESGGGFQEKMRKTQFSFLGNSRGSIIIWVPFTESLPGV